MKKIIITGILVVLLSLPTLAFAENVHVTKHGKKYHKAGCRLIQNKETDMKSLQEAEQEDIEPCLKCFKEKVLEAPSPKESKKLPKKSEGGER